ncbi:MAG: Dabb family protein [Betaproteobacteria bacterium]|nr:Dabb family protein [Betaproteobacteria bacterium]
MIRHIFLWKVAPGVDPEAAVRLFNRLPKAIPWIRSWEIGPHHGPRRYGNTWDYGMTVDFDSLEDFNRYSDHPVHKEIVPQVVPMFAARAVLDFELSSGK